MSSLTSIAKHRQAFAEALYEAMYERGMGQEQLARRLNLRQSTISAWVTGDALPPDPATVFKLEKVLSLIPGHLSRELGFLPAEPGGSYIEVDTVALLLADDELDDASKQALIHLYEVLLGKLRTAAKDRHPTGKASARAKAKPVTVSGRRRAA